MAAIRVIQRRAHLAGPVRCERGEVREGKVARAVLVAIGNKRRGGGARQDEPTAIQCTRWGGAAENAARDLGTGSHVNVLGRFRHHRYEKDGETVYTLDFTADEVDHLDSRAEKEAREGRHDPGPTPATRLARNTRTPSGDQPLNEDQTRAAAPSIFAAGRHASCSERCTYIPTIEVLRGLRREGLEPFMSACHRPSLGPEGP